MTEIRRWSVLVNAGYSSKLSRLCGPMRAEGAAAIVDLAKVSSEFSLLKLSRGNVLMRLNDFTPWQEARHGLNRNLKALPFTTLDLHSRAECGHCEVDPRVGPLQWFACPLAKISSEPPYQWALVDTDTCEVWFSSCHHSASRKFS